MKVKVLKPFALGGQEFLSGEADVPDKSVKRLVEKSLAAPLDGPQSSSGAPVDAQGAAQGAGQDGADNGHLLETVAARISSGLGVARSSDETAPQFLDRFADECSEVAAEMTRRVKEAERATAAAQLERDEAIRQREEVVAENDKLRAELEALKSAAAGTPETGGEAKKPAKSKAE
jgi:hypothetical protein